ncbi:hypothetical protein KCU91_g6533, partial [Aureobasidium melanogenum]
MPPDLGNNWKIGGWLLRSQHAPSQTATTNEADKPKHDFELLESENSTLSSEIDELRNENALLKDEKSDLLNQTDQLQTELEALELDNSRMSSEFKRLEAEFDRFAVRKKAACEERDRALSEKLALCTEIDTKDSQIRELQREILQYKKSLASTTRIDGQLSDMKIQDAMNGLFFAVRDWALKVVRQDKTVSDLISQETAQILNRRILRHKSGAPLNNAYALIVLVAETLCSSMNQGWVFGASRMTKEDAQSAIDVANLLHASIKMIPGVTPERKKQWVFLTNEIVSKDEEAAKRAHKTYVTAVAHHVKSKLEDHPSASIDSKRYKFSSKYMEDVNGEEEGILQAAFFSGLYKIIKDDGGQKETVVCKAKVMVQT